MNSLLTVNQTYLSVSEVNTEFGHVSMGRSFALDMGALIPNSDQRLGMSKARYTEPAIGQLTHSN